VPLAGGTDALGVVLAGYEHSSLARLVHRGYVSRLEVESSDFLQHRSEIQELSRTIANAALETAFARDIAREANRVAAPLRAGNPPESADTTRRPVGIMRSLMAAVKDRRRSTALAVARLLQTVNPELLGRVDGLVRRDASGGALKRFRTLTARYAGRSEIPEYLALVILELVNNLQMQTMQNVAKRSGMTQEKLRSLYQNPNARAKIAETMERQGETSMIGWSFTTRRGSGNHTTELTVTLSGAGAPMRAFSEEVQQHRSVDIGQRSLQEFYREIDGSVFNIDLGLYYLSYLEELCRKAGMLFATRVHEVGYDNAMVVTLRIGL
jgi:hypothetical protein